MSQRRPLSPTEQMVDVFDRASTLNFSMLARVRGPLTAAALEHGLRCLEQRHPLLRARVERGATGAAFVLGEAAPIPLRVEDGPVEAWRELAEQSLAHRVWADEGPRAELTWLRHGPEHSTLLLCLHHLVSDGSSGVFALRDLLGFAADPAAVPQTLAAPPQSAFYPPGHGGAFWKLRALAMILRSRFAAKPRRLQQAPAESNTPRTGHLMRLQLSAAELERLMQRARQDGATVQGVLCAALARGVAVAVGEGAIPERILHPVDLRRYLQTQYAGLATPGEASGYYVSSVDTDHRVDVTAPLAALAREISEAVKRRKEQQAPWLTAPLAGPLLTRRVTRAGDLPRFRDYVEQKVVFNTFGVTNLGPLEKLGVNARVGALQVEDMFFATAGSVLGALGGSATTFNGELSLVIRWVEPLIAREAAERVVESTRRELALYAGAEAATPGARPQLSESAP